MMWPQQSVALSQLPKGKGKGKSIVSATKIDQSVTICDNEINLR